MADSKDVVEKPWQKEARMVKHHIHRGSKFPPFSIEPMPYERQRLAGMTAEDRVLRRQWLADQELAPNEPRKIPIEMRPRNIFKRIYGKPWDIFFRSLQPLMGTNAASMGRFLVPKFCLMMFVVYGCYYHVKYNHKTWESSSGWHIYYSRDVMLHGQPLPPKEHDDFVDRGFKSRKALVDLKTSAS